MRVAYFSPLPPAESGIADYSTELLPHLAQHVDLTLFCDPRRPPASWLRDAFEVAEIGRFPECRPEFDVTVYHMGNAAPYHEPIWRTLRVHPGIVVVHEPLFYHFFQQITVSRDDVPAFIKLIEASYGTPAAQRVLTHLHDGLVNPVAFPLLEPVLAGARGAIVHNRFAARQVIQRCPEVPVSVIPHHLSLPAPFDNDVDRDAVRRALGLAGRFVVGTFGFLTPWKRIPVALTAFARLRQTHPSAVYCLVGEVNLERDLDDLIDEAGLPHDAVRVTGRVPLDEFLSYMVATDVAVNLRYPTAGETSGTLIRLLGLGVPTIVSDAGSFAEFPADVCAHVPVDGFEEETLAAMLRALAEDVGLRRAMSANARAYVRTHHTLAGSAQAYADFIAQVVAGEAEPAHPTSTSPTAELMAEIGGILAGWGVTEHDDALLEPVAQALAHLAISPNPRR